MQVSKITNFIQAYQVNQAHVKEFSLPKFSSTDLRTVRSAAVRFNLTTTYPLRCTFNVKEIRIHANTLLQNYDPKAWAGVGLWFASAAFMLNTAVNFMALANSRTQESANGHCPSSFYASRQWEEQTRMLRDGALIAFTLSTIASFLLQDRESFVIKVKFSAITERALPEKLINNRSENGNLIDPVTWEEIPQDQLFCPRYIHVANVITTLPACLAILLRKELIEEYTGLLDFQNPLLDGCTLTLEENKDLEKNLIRGLCLYAGAAKYNVSLQEIWHTEEDQDATSRFHQRLEKLLEKFDPSVHNFLITNPVISNNQ